MNCDKPFSHGLVMSRASQLLLGYLLLLASLLYLVLILLLASKMFPLVDPDVADILAAAGIPGLHAHTSFPDIAGFPTFQGVPAIAGYPIGANIPMPSPCCLCF
jgi:hypothetical protein